MHRKIMDPVRSPIYKPMTGGLVLESVTIGESLLLYVFFGGSLFPSLVPLFQALSWWYRSDYLSYFQSINVIATMWRHVG